MIGHHGHHGHLGHQPESPIDSIRRIHGLPIPDSPPIDGAEGVADSEPDHASCLSTAPSSNETAKPPSPTPPSDRRIYVLRGERQESFPPGSDIPADAHSFTWEGATRWYDPPSRNGQGATLRC